MFSLQSQLIESSSRNAYAEAKPYTQQANILNGDEVAMLYAMLRTLPLKDEVPFQSANRLPREQLTDQKLFAGLLGLLEKQTEQAAFMAQYENIFRDRS